MTCLGKIIGGGLPIGAVAGRSEIMRQLAPEGPVYQAGTLSGNPLALAAGLATLKTAAAERPYAALALKAETMARGLSPRNEEVAAWHTVSHGGLFTIFFTPGPVRNLADARTCSTEAYARFFHGMLGKGFYLPPSQFETCFVSAAHSEADVRSFLEAARALLDGSAAAPR